MLRASSSVSHTSHANAKTKIVATLGPASCDKPTIRSLLEAGMTVARCNMSHGDHAAHAALMATARAAARAAKRPLALLQDLCGPKIRIGDFSTESVELHRGSAFTLTTERCVGDASHVSVSYAKLPREVASGMRIFLNDGKLELEVVSTTDTELHTSVIHGGVIRGRRGVNVPDASLSLSALTAKDRADVRFGIAQGVDLVTLSFVREARDITELRSLIRRAPDIKIVAKIETKAAIANLDAIIDAADAVMVARGDLAIEVPPERVPLLQKQIIRAANRAGKPVITATQMLDSMRTSPVPTRAEVNDVANAILDGTDAVMLSDETAVGEHPARAVSTMARIARETEAHELFDERHAGWDFPPRSTCDAVSRSIVTSARALNARAIVALSESGYTGRMVARYRPRVPIVVVTPSEATFSMSLLSYGCEPVHIPRIKNLADARAAARRILKARGLAAPGDTYILGAGLPFGKPGATNMLLVERM